MALLDEIEAVAQARTALRVHRATVQVGPLSGVEPALLLRAFEVARLARPTTTQTVLTIDTAEIRVACVACDCESVAAVNNIACRQCGSLETRLVHGDELLLLQVELDIPEPSAPGASVPAEDSRGACHV
jgi:hydrogenase nickel incorporation protein HypA/HybF